jgi:hypothetical protein
MKKNFGVKRSTVTPIMLESTACRAPGTHTAGTTPKTKASNVITIASDVAHLVAREDRIGRNVDPGVGHLALTGQMAEIRGVRAGQDQRDAGHRPHVGDVFNAEACMRMRRAPRRSASSSLRVTAWPMPNLDGGMRCLPTDSGINPGR